MESEIFLRFTPILAIFLRITWCWNKKLPIQGTNIHGIYVYVEHIPLHIVVSTHPHSLSFSFIFAVGKLRPSR